MQLSVVVPTLNGRERLSGCLDALAARAPDAEVVVVNGPSTDGTTGMVCDRDDVDVLLELSERNVNVARNAGAAATSGDVVAFLSDALRPDPGWTESMQDAVDDGADTVAGPVHREGVTPADPGRRRPAEVSDVRGANLAVTGDALASIDGFDEYLLVDGATDAAHRLAANGLTTDWAPGMRASRDVETDGGSPVQPTDPGPTAAGSTGWTYRALAYRLAKNHGVRPSVVGRVLGKGLGDAWRGVRMVLDDDVTATGWLGGGRTAGSNVILGLKDGVAARFGDRTPSRNPHGLSTRSDRPVECYDWR